MYPGSIESLASPQHYTFLPRDPAESDQSPAGITVKFLYGCKNSITSVVPMLVGSFIRSTTGMLCQRDLSKFSLLTDIIRLTKKRDKLLNLYLI